MRRRRGWPDDPSCACHGLRQLGYFLYLGGDEPAAGASLSTATSATATLLTPLMNACESHSPTAHSARRKSGRRAGMATAIRERAGEGGMRMNEMESSSPFTYERKHWITARPRSYVAIKSLFIVFRIPRERAAETDDILRWCSVTTGWLAGWLAGPAVPARRTQGCPVIDSSLAA